MAKHLMVIGIDADLMVSLFSMKISDDLTVGRKACSYQKCIINHSSFEYYRRERNERCSKTLVIFLVVDTYV